jgi:hypothetical protein
LPPRRSSSTIQGTSPVPPPDYLRPTVKRRFYVDSRTGLPHIDGHAVTESEVEEVLGGPGEDRLGEEGARVALGQTAAGRYLRVVYVPDRARQRVRHHGVYSRREGPRGLQAPAAQEAAAMRQNKFPPGWDEARVQRVLAHYETQTGEEAVAEDEAAFEANGPTVMEVPRELVPRVRELIAKHRK